MHQDAPIVKVFTRLALGLALGQALAHGLAADATARQGSQPALSASPGPERLDGTWSLSLCGDFALESGADIQSLYPAGSVAAQPRALDPGFALGVRRHFGESFFGGFELGSLPKGYTINAFGNQDLWQISGLEVGGTVDWIFARVSTLTFFAGYQAGWVTLAGSTLDRSGGQIANGTLDGSGFGQEAGLGIQWTVLPSVALEVQGGWRGARIPVRLDVSGGNPWPPSDSPDIDFSGPFARLGLDFTWGLRNPWGESEAPPPPPPPGSQQP